MANLLIVDDEESYRSVLSVVFEKEGYNVKTAENGTEALALVGTWHCDLIVSDVRMPDMDGIALLKAVREFDADLRVVLMTAFGTLETAREAFKLGADDFIQKPFQNDELKLIVERTLEKQTIVKENRAFRRAQRNTGSIQNIIGNSRKMEEIFGMIDSMANETATVLITGESGTGKELVARAIHDRSPRADKPFIPINCGAIPEHLLEAELFGFIKGTFTGAAADRIGLFEAANGGTILLDEIGDMPLLMQVKVLRVLQDNKVRPIGSATEIPVDTRVIAATNCDMNKRIEEGSFRRDLFYRLSVMPLHIPPLRERVEDIPTLVRHFVDKFSVRSEKSIRISDDAVKTLQERPWEGNVRELEHVIERAVALTPDKGEISPELCKDDLNSGTQPMLTLPGEGLHLPTLMNDIERSMVVEAFRRTGGNQTQAAKILQIPVHSYRHLLGKHEIQFENDVQDDPEAKVKDQRADS